QVPEPLDTRNSVDPSPSKRHTRPSMANRCFESCLLTRPARVCDSLEKTQDSSGYTCDNSSSGYILSHDRPSSDNSSFSNGHVGHDDSPNAYPGIPLDDDFPANRLYQHRGNPGMIRVGRSYERDPRTDRNPVAENQLLGHVLENFRHDHVFAEIDFGADSETARPTESNPEIIPGRMLGQRLEKSLQPGATAVPSRSR